jgi:glycosyltransferase involved in cell wall biosynthesis
MCAISVVVPLYNKERYIRRCLESICRQSMRDFEVVVVDDGSTDASAAIAASFPDERIRVIRQENRGEGGARNRGIRESRSEVVALLDSDDEWRPQFLEAVVALRRAYPEAGVLATGYKRCRNGPYDMETTLADPLDGGTQRLVPNYFSLAMRGNVICSSSVAVLRSVLDEVGGFPEGEPYGADRDLWVRIALRYPLAYDVRIFAIYHSEAEGRVQNRPPAGPVCPPAVRTIRRAIQEGRIPKHRLQEVEIYSDLTQMQYVYWQLQIRHRENAFALLRQRYFRPWFRVLAIAWRILLSFLPMRVVEAIRLKPRNVVQRLKPLLTKSAPEYRYKDLVIRDIPVEARDKDLQFSASDLQATL